MQQDLLTMDGGQLLSEYIILNKVRDNLELLMVYNIDLRYCIDKVENDIKRVVGQMSLKSCQFKKVDLSSLGEFTESQSRTRYYLDMLKNKKNNS
jgi:hypothetical protein